MTLEELFGSEKSQDQSFYRFVIERGTQLTGKKASSKEGTAETLFAYDGEQNECKNSKYTHAYQKWTCPFQGVHDGLQRLMHTVSGQGSSSKSVIGSLTAVPLVTSSNRLVLRTLRARKI